MNLFTHLEVEFVKDFGRQRRLFRVLSAYLFFFQIIHRREDYMGFSIKREKYIL